MPKKQVLLIDANNLGYAAIYQPALAKLSHEGRPTGAILGLVQSVLRLSRKFPEYTPIVLWDGVAQWRHDLLPEYKAQRSDTPEKVAIHDSWAQQRGIAMALLLAMGFIQIRAADAEADDLVHGLTQSLDPYDSAILCSADKDWWQAIRPAVLWHNPIHGHTVDWDRFCSDPALVGGKNMAPFAGAQEYLLAKAISGDTSDGIAGVPGVGMITALQLLRKWSDPEDCPDERLAKIGNAVQQGQESSARGRAIAGSFDLVERNRILMDWSLAQQRPAVVGLTAQEFDAQEAAAWCEGNGLHSLLPQIKERPAESARADSTKTAVLDWLDSIFPATAKLVVAAA